MKIALMPTTFSNQYAESSHITLVLLAKELKKKGHTACIISCGDKRFPEEETFKGIKIYRGPRLRILGSLQRIISPAIKLRELEKKGIKFDIVHNFSAAKIFVLRAILAGKFIKNKKVKIIHTLKSYSYYKLGGAFSRLLNLADVITVPTKVFAEDISKRGCRREKIKIIRSPIDFVKFKSLNRKKSKPKTGIKGRFILYYGTSSENKGFDVLIKSSKDILNNKDLKLAIILRYGVPEKYKKIIESFGIKGKVILIGKPVNNIRDYVGAAEMVILPYRDLVSTEGNPSCLLESMAAKTTVVTTDILELREIVENGKEVLMVKPGDAKSLVKGINMLLLNKKLQKKLTENAYKKSKEFDIKKITKQFISLYKKLIS